MGEEAYRQILRQSVLSDNSRALRAVREVGERIARVADRPDYRWEFRVIYDPEMVNAFALPGGKVAVYTGLFPVARDDAGLAVVLGHEVAHALLRHAGERMSQSGIVGAGLALVGASGVNPQILQALGLGASVGLILPFSRAQEAEADRVGLILMAKAGYDPRVAVELWERMEKKESGQSPPEFLSTHPGYQRRTQQLKEWIPEALEYYRPTNEPWEALPSLQELETPALRAEAELLKRIQALNQQVTNPQRERAVVEILAYRLRLDPSLIFRERQQLGIGYGDYAALQGLSSLGRSPLRQIAVDYQKGVSWLDLCQNHGGRISDLTRWMEDIRRELKGAPGLNR